MARFGGVHEERRRAGRGERRGDLARDMAGFADPGDDDAAGWPGGSARRSRQRATRAGLSARSQSRQCRGCRPPACAARTRWHRWRRRGRLEAIGDFGLGMNVVPKGDMRPERHPPMPLTASLPCAEGPGEAANTALNRPLTIIVLTPLTTFSAVAAREPFGEVCDRAGVFLLWVGGLPRAKDGARVFCCALLPCLALIAFPATMRALRA